MKKRRRRFRRIAIFILLIFIIGSVYYVYKNRNVGNNTNDTTKEQENSGTKSNQTQPDTYLGNVTNDSGTNIESAWQDVIVKYMDIYTKSLVNLEEGDVTTLFTTPSGTEAYLTQNAMDLLVEHHQMQLSDMKLSYASYDLNYQSAEVKGNKITIKFLETDHYKFNYLGDTESDIYDVSNTIVLNNNNGTYTIDSLRVVQGQYIMFTNEVDTTSSTAKSTIDTLKAKYIKEMKEEVQANKQDMDEANSKSYVAPKKCDYDYNRDDAVAYSYKYVTTRNSEYTAYDNSGGNCANFASQSVHAGGIPMDYTGLYQWKHYSSTLNTSNTASGRSASWISTTGFYDYASNNTGTGLCSDTNVNIFYAEPGDVGQVGYKGYSHSIFVVSQVKKDGKVIDLLVNSNTVSLKDYPLLGYVYPNKRIIKILGYNK